MSRCSDGGSRLRRLGVCAQVEGEFLTGHVLWALEGPAKEGDGKKELGLMLLMFHPLFSRLESVLILPIPLLPLSQMLGCFELLIILKAVEIW